MENDKGSCRCFVKTIRSGQSHNQNLSIMGDVHSQWRRNWKSIPSITSGRAGRSHFIPAVFGLAETYRFKTTIWSLFENINVFFPGISEVDVQMKTDYMKQILEARGFVSTFHPQVNTLFMSTRSWCPSERRYYSYVCCRVYLIINRKTRRRTGGYEGKPGSLQERLQSMVSDIAGIIYCCRLEVVVWLQRPLENFTWHTDFGSLTEWPCGRQDSWIRP